MRFLEQMSLYCALAAALGICIEYAILVPLKRNPNGQRFFMLLIVIVAVLSLSVFRVLTGIDYNFRAVLTAGGLYIFSVVLIMIGASIWHDQIQGAKRYRENHPKKDHIDD